MVDQSVLSLVSFYTIGICMYFTFRYLYKKKKPISRVVRRKCHGRSNFKAQDINIRKALVYVPILIK